MGRECSPLPLIPSLHSRSPGHSLLNSSVSAVQCWEGLGLGAEGLQGGEALQLPFAPQVEAGTRVQMSSARSYLHPSPPCRKFEFNPKWGIDNPVLSLAEDFDPSGNPLALDNHSLSPEIPQLLTPSISLVTTPLCLPLITALVGSNCVEVGGGWLLSSVQATLPTWYLASPSST